VLEDDNDGIPGLEAVLNRLEDIQRVIGGAAEMFWRGGFPGYDFSRREGAAFGTQTLDQMQAEIEDYIHGLKRYMRLQGIDVKALEQQVADPRPTIEALIDLVAAAKEIPKRILMGSERGELASSQDTREWNEKTRERQTEHCEPRILRPFIDQLVKVGVLPEPSDDYTVDWPEPVAEGAKEQAEIAGIKTTAIVGYANSPGAESIVPAEVFLRDIVGLAPEIVEKIEALLGEIAGAPMEPEIPASLPEGQPTQEGI
jgi:uncharacterized protein